MQHLVEKEGIHVLQKSLGDGFPLSNQTVFDWVGLVKVKPLEQAGSLINAIYHFVALHELHYLLPQP